ncbi:hypothetical protein J6590_050234 [Homalodisca vitripennis]|nr:hypothetical protein J6590_050234 [Homalodisca vitripennis]
MTTAIGCALWSEFDTTWIGRGLRLGEEPCLDPHSQGIQLCSRICIKSNGGNSSPKITG